jgi:inositol-pentakisphosphate 2-kinase
MPPDVLQTRPADWKYVSEGGATIVYSYKGPSHSDFDGTVLRLRKVQIVTTSGIKADPVAISGEEENDDPTIEFQAKCMRRLIPPEHLPRLETVLLSKPWLEVLVELQDHVRPETRRQKDQVDLTKVKGVLATDLVGGNWLAVEIKVKLQSIRWSMGSDCFRMS